MKTIKTQKYTYESCLEQAKKHSSRFEFYQHNSALYQYARKKNWLEQMCGELGWERKNSLLWTQESCLEEACRFPTTSQWRKESPVSYMTSSKNKWLKDICEKRGWYFTKDWTMENLISEAKNYNTISDFYRANRSAYYYARKLKCLEEICVHMKPKVRWTKEMCAIEALKYKTRSEFADNCSSAHGKAHANKWLQEICAHMPKYAGKWDKDKCHVESLKHTTRTKFKDANPSAYLKAYLNGWLDEICGHMVNGYAERYKKEA